jgi:hypothetical protein
MAPKPHRALIERVSNYADEASAFLRRRRLTRRPFARIYVPGGRGLAFDAETEPGRELFLAASRVLDVAR